MAGVRPVQADADHEKAWAHLEEDYWSSAIGRNTAEHTASFTLSANPFAVHDVAGQHLEVYGLTGTSSLGEYYWAPATAGRPTTSAATYSTYKPAHHLTPAPLVPPP